MTLFVFVFASILILFDLHAIFNYSNEILKKQLIQVDKKLQLRRRLIISFTIWSLRNLIFMFLTLIPWANPNYISIIAKILFFIPSSMFLFFIFKNFLTNINKFKIKYLTFYIIFVPIFTLLFYAGETAFDSFAYHLPIELLLRDSGSLWFWPDLIFTQWGLIGGDITNALYHFAFNSPRIGSAVSISILIYLIMLALTLSNLKLSIFFMLSILTIPSILGQVNSRYVDVLLGTALFSIFIFVKDTIVKTTSKLDTFILLVLISYTVSIKLSALPVLFLVYVYHMYSKYNSKIFSFKKEILKYILIYTAGSMIGLFPIFFRNFISFRNPLMPFYFRDSNSGIIDISKFSTQIDQSYAEIIGVQNSNSFYQAFYQYIFTPINFYQKILLEIFNNKKFDLELLKSQNELFSIFTYDNRIGGYGVISLIFMIILVLNVNKTSLKLFLGIIVIFPFLPGVIHPRYALGYILILLWVVTTTNSLNKILQKKFLNFILISILSFSTFINLYSFYQRTFNNGIGFYQFDRHQFALSQWINSECRKVAHFGIGLWSGTAFWGPNFCGKVVYSKIINGAILSYDIGPKKFMEIDRKKVNQLIAENGKDLIFVCTLRWNEVTDYKDPNFTPTLCDELGKTIYNNSDFQYEVSDYMNDNFQGPKIQTIKIIEKND